MKPLWRALAPVLKATLPMGGSAALLLALVAPAGAATSSAATWAQRAKSAYAAMQHYLYGGPSSHNLYREDYPVQPGDNPYSYEWTNREATAGLVALANVAGVTGLSNELSTRFSTFSYYWSSNPGTEGYESYVLPPLGSGGDLYYDDNAVTGLEFIRGYATTGDASLVRHAEDAFAAVTRGWDSDPSHVCPGGERWNETTSNNIRAANVTGLGDELATHLYLITHQQSYLDWGIKLFRWNQQCLEASPGLYWNAIGYDGTIDHTFWSYNSGAMIGAATLLYRATGQRSYLSDAVAEAAGAMAYWTADNRLYDQPAVFNAYLFNNLLLLDSQTHSLAYLNEIRTYAEDIYANNRDPQTGLFHFGPGGGGSPQPSVPAQTLEQSAVVQIFSSLAWPRNDWTYIA